MATFTVAEAKAQFSDLLRRAEYRGERSIVERHGRPVAGIVSTDDLNRLEALEDAEDVADAATALGEAERVGTIPLETVLERHGLAHLLERSGHKASPPRAKARRVSRRTSTRTRPAAGHRRG